MSDLLRAEIDGQSLTDTEIVDFLVVLLLGGLAAVVLLAGVAAGVVLTGGGGDDTTLQASERTGLLHCRFAGDRVILGGRCQTVIVGQFQL